MLFLQEGRTGEAWETFKKTMLFRVLLSAHNGSLGARGGAVG
jgi:hypothetical protein